MVSVVLGPSASLPKEYLEPNDNENVAVAVIEQEPSHVSIPINLEQCSNNFSSAALELVVPPIVQVLQAAWSQ